VRCLRRSCIVARWVLAWYALFVGVSIASPLIEPTTLQMVCSMGMKMVVVDSEGTAADEAHGLDCPLCAPFAPTSRTWALSFARPDALAHALRPAVAAHLAWVTRSPLPARGPPLAA
jgi:hypothetical protein